MADIREFPDLDELERFLGELFKRSVRIAIDEVPELETELQSLKLEEILVFASWANDNATVGQTQLSLGFILDVPDEILEEDPAELENYIDARNLLGEVINAQRSNLALFNDYFDGFDIDMSFQSNREDFIIFKINVTDSVQAYSLTNDLNIQVIQEEPEFQGGPPQTVLEETPAGIREPIEEEEPEPESEPEPEPEEPEIEEPEPEPEELEPVPPPEPEEPEEPEEVVPEFPEVPDPLQPFAISPDKIDIPVGKETKTVNVRPIYDWEIELASPQGDLDGGIGAAMRAEDETFGQGIPPGTFPRTGTYIKYHLLHEGPSYVLEMYNDLVIYSGFISTMHAGTFRTGDYDSFRAYLDRVRLIPQRGGPQLIRQLTPQQANAMGLETLADHPSIAGAKAPWLERRMYYNIIEENIDHPAWNNIAEFVSQLTEEA